MDNQKAPAAHHHNRSAFSGKLGYVLATAGASVGLGNIWRFPYLAAKYGGGVFLLTYLILMLTFGYTMLISETAMGRMTKHGPVGAFAQFSKSGWSKGGAWINAIVPIIILPYYSVIGGWVVKYLAGYITGATQAMAGDDYFGGFIGDGASVELWFLIFSIAVILVIIAGVEKGIERVAKIMMPILVVLAVVIAVYSMTRPGAAEGIKYFLVPNFHDFSIMTIVAAMGQMFYSLSIAMGILYTYGSYMHKDVDLERTQLEVGFFDSGIAVLAGLMIIPAVFAFSGGDHDAILQSGPSLMFVTLPKVFASMGIGRLGGFLFFVLVLFAALTSAIALAETCTSTFVDQLGWNRVRATILVFVIMVGLGTLSSLGFNTLSFITIIGMDFLDFFDFISNSVMMPIGAAATCLFILHTVKVQTIEEEVRLSGPFRWVGLYRFCLKYLAPAFCVIILVSAVLNVFGVISI
ncbi:MAG: sodium-dependent transporter [Firmicutes bacterium]|nr:sodium-dependent transporter [Bacillota bacterium]